MTTRLTEKSYWEYFWENLALPVEQCPAKIHELHKIMSQTLPVGRHSLIEVGCAPGGWLAYYYKYFGYCVTGIEYAEKAYEKTVTNLQMLGVPADLHLVDFFEFETGQYDMVFSGGFIEHFSDPTRVVSRMARLCAPGGGLVITLIPAMRGLNWWISKMFRPSVAAVHNPIGLQKLVTLHEAAGLETVVAQHYGCGIVSLPFQKNQFSARHPWAARTLNLPFNAWNRIISLVTRKTGRYPDLEWCAGGLMYIGRK